jgi:hypothetical protein
MQGSPSDVASHLIVYHWGAVRSALLLVVIGGALIVSRLRRRGR